MMKIPNLEHMIQEVELDITYTVCENCMLYLNEHHIISKAVREPNISYTVRLVCPMLTNLYGRDEYVCFKSKLMPHEDALYYMNCMGHKVWRQQQEGIGGGGVLHPQW